MIRPVGSPLELRKHDGHALLPTGGDDFLGRIHLGSDPRRTPVYRSTPLHGHKNERGVCCLKVYRHVFTSYKLLKVASDCRLIGHVRINSPQPTPKGRSYELARLVAQRY